MPPNSTPGPKRGWGSRPGGLHGVNIAPGEPTAGRGEGSAPREGQAQAAFPSRAALQCRARSHGTSDVLRGHQAAGCEAGLNPRHKGVACLREPQAKKKKKKHFQEGRIKTDGGNKRNKKLYLKKKSGKFNNTQRYGRAGGGVRPCSRGGTRRAIGRAREKERQLFWAYLVSFFKRAVKELSQKAVYLHASSGGDFSSLWQCLLHWYLRQQIPAP